MNLEDIEVFLQIAEGESLSRAATVLHKPKATVSHQLRRLETELGIALFYREKNAISLNSAGAGFRRHAEAILRSVTRARDAAAAAQQDLAGEIAIAASSEFVSELISPILLRFAQVAQEIRITVMNFPRDSLAEVRGRFDCVFHLGDPPLPQFAEMNARLLGSFRYGLCASPDYLERHGVPMAPNDLLSHELIGLYDGASLRKWELRGPGGSFSLAPEPLVMSNANWIAKLAAVHGYGICYMPEFFTGLEREAGMLQRVLPDWASEPVPVYALYWPHRSASRPIRQLLDIAVQEFPNIGAYIYTASRRDGLVRKSGANPAGSAPERPA